MFDAVIVPHGLPPPPPPPPLPPPPLPPPPPPPVEPTVRLTLYVLVCEPLLTSTVTVPPTVTTWVTTPFPNVGSPVAVTPSGKCHVNVCNAQSGLYPP